MMRRRRLLYLLTLLLSFSFVATYAQSGKMRKAFMEMPELLLPTLPKSERSQLLQNFDEGAGGSISILELNNSYMKLQMDEWTVVQLKLLPKGCGRYIVALSVTNLHEPMLSVIAFYDRAWNRIETEKLFTYPEPEVFLKDSADSTRIEVKNALMERAAMTYAIDLAPERNELRLYLTTFNDPLAKQLHPKAAPLFRDEPLSYRWRRGKFVL